MPVSHSDRYKLANSSAFKNRVRMALIRQAGVVIDEAATQPHYSRRRPFAIGIVNSPDSYAPRFADAVTATAPVMDAATANGSIVLDDANADTRQASVTDAQIDAAIGAVFNYFCAHLG